MCRKGRGVKRRGAAWDGDVVSDEERIPEDDHLNSEPRDRLRRASNALQLSAAPKRLPCRENERDNIENFVLEMLSAPGGDGRTLYVAGMPGTGQDSNSEGSCKSAPRNGQRVSVRGGQRDAAAAAEPRVCVAVGRRSPVKNEVPTRRRGY